MNNEMFGGGNEIKKEIQKWDVIKSLEHLKDGITPSEKDLEVFLEWREQERAKYKGDEQHLALVKLNFDEAIILLNAGLRNAAIDAFDEATTVSEYEGPDADEIYRAAYDEFAGLLKKIDEK